MKRHGPGYEWLDGWPFLALAFILFMVAVASGAFR